MHKLAGIKWPFYMEANFSKKVLPVRVFFPHFYGSFIAEVTLIFQQYQSCHFPYWYRCPIKVFVICLKVFFNNFPIYFVRKNTHRVLNINKLNYWCFENSQLRIFFQFSNHFVRFFIKLANSLQFKN